MSERRIAKDELERIRNYLAQWTPTVNVGTPEGIPLAKQLLSHAEALEAQLAAREEELRRVGAVIERYDHSGELCAGECVPDRAQVVKDFRAALRAEEDAG